MEEMFRKEKDGRKAQDGVRSGRPEEKGDRRPMMEEVIAVLRALVNIFDLISRNLNKKK